MILDSYKSVGPGTRKAYQFFSWRIVVKNNEEFVFWLWRGASGTMHSNPSTIADYMREFAERAYAVHQHFIRIGNVDDFVTDLMAVGYVTISDLN